MCASAVRTIVYKFLFVNPKKSDDVYLFAMTYKRDKTLAASFQGFQGISK